MSHAQIVFTGILVFVTAMGNAPTTVIGINATEPVMASNGQEIPAHVTWLYFEAGDLAADSPVRPDEVVEWSGRSYGLVRLRGESVRVSSAVADRDLEIVDGVPGDDDLGPTAANSKFLYWVPRLRDVYPGEHALNPAYLAKSPDPDLVTMRFELPRGTLRTGFITPDKWEFRPSIETPIRRELAQEVILDVATTAPLALTLQDFRTKSERVLKFNRRDPVVTIGNTPEFDIFPDGSHAHTMAVDHHFELYYRVYKEPPAVKPIPNRIEGGRVPGGGRFRVAVNRPSGVNCPPARVP